MIDASVPLHSISLGKKTKVKNLTCDGGTRRRMLDLGFIPDTDVEVLYKSPSGDPKAYQIRGTVIALRSEEASNILVETV